MVFPFLISEGCSEGIEHENRADANGDFEVYICLCNTILYELNVLLTDIVIIWWFKKISWFKTFDWGRDGGWRECLLGLGHMWAPLFGLWFHFYEVVRYVLHPKRTTRRWKELLLPRFDLFKFLLLLRVKGAFGWT